MGQTNTNLMVIVRHIAVSLMTVAMLGACDSGAITPDVTGEGADATSTGDTSGADDVVCGEGEIVACDGATCLDAARQGDETCDDAFNCGSLDYDGGDCLADVGCTDGEVEACSPDACIAIDSVGDGTCDEAANCELHEFDGGDCVSEPEPCGDGECSALDGETETSCPEDCVVSPCDDDQIVGCDESTCMPALSYGDGTCDEALNCDALQSDGGDCATTGACGDGACSGTEDATSCPADCADEVGCKDGEILACDGVACLAAGLLGDGNCDAALDCAALDGDGGDCGAAPGCGDGTCDSFGGETLTTCPVDCACADGDVEVCTGGSCVGEDWIADGICDLELSCIEFDYDGGDCELAECTDAEVQSCDGLTCFLASAVGDGLCDGGLACDQYDNDGGDCDPVECDPGFVLGCDQLTCYEASITGDGVCDAELDCPEANFDGGDCAPVSECGDGMCSPDESCNSCAVDCGACLDGSTCCLGSDTPGCDDAGCSAAVCALDSFCCETSFDTFCVACAKGGPGYGGVDCSGTATACDFCHTCGDGICDANAGDTCDNCPEDCEVCICTDGMVNGCDGVCISEASIGNGFCDTGLDCDEFNTDGGDCLVCPEGEVASCIGTCMDASRLGDGTCDVDLQCLKLNFDEGDCEALCSQNQVVNCDNGCTSATWPGDGICDAMLNCEEWDYDEGDCPIPCAEGTQWDCDGVCQDSSLFGDGNCDPFFQCVGQEWDGGDCPVICSDGYLVNCNDGCTSATWPGDGICDASLNCEAFGWDEGDCPIPCPEGQAWDCEENCVDEAWLADGTCQPVLACQATGWDGMDCDPVCPDGQIVNCVLGCTSATWPGDNICDSVLNCAEWDYDEGDCTPPVCGDGACTADETFESCADDCDAPPECGNANCEAGEDVSCPEDCVPVCGDGTCDAEVEDYMNCLEDCEAPFVCGDDLCEEGETEESCPDDCLVIEPCADVGFAFMSAEAATVLVSGDFNEWATGEDATAMVNDGDGGWSVTIALTAGVHQYKFIVDDEWTQDPSNAMETDDGMGGMNSVLYVSCGDMIDVAGLWESNGGFTLDISNATFVQDNLGGAEPFVHEVALYDNDTNAAIVKSGWDGSYEVIVWTDIDEDGAWWYCQAVTGQDSVLAAYEAEAAADATDPSAGGCGELGFAWNKMLPLPGCEPVTECTAEMACGTMSDGCGGTVTCDTCGDGETCTDGECVVDCVPASGCSDGMNCGTMADGCGGMLECGSCGDDETCNAGTCEANVSAPQCDATFAGCTEDDFAAGDMTAQDGPVAVNMVAFAPYSPKCLRVQVGQTVTIQAMESHPFEMVCAEDDVMDTQDGSMIPVEFVFATPGYYNYRCLKHPGSMMGNIQVVP
jgi:plastocyanin